MPHSLWDILPTEIQEIIVDNSFQLCREEYLEYNKKRHEKNKKKQGRGMLTADILRFVMASTDPIEILEWAFPTEFLELQMHIDQPYDMEINDCDYTEYYDFFLKKAVDFLDDKQNDELWISPNEDHWLSMFTKLNDFHRKHSHLNILYEESGSPSLYGWLEYQKDPDTLKAQPHINNQGLGFPLLIKLCQTFC